jgi:hypothetical protein
MVHPDTVATSRGLDVIAAPVPVPFPEDDLLAMDAQDWLRIPIIRLRARRLVPTQALVSIEGIVAVANIDDERPIYAVADDIVSGRILVWDGHHRWTPRAILDEFVFAHLVDRHGNPRPDVRTWGDL